MKHILGPTTPLRLLAVLLLIAGTTADAGGPKEALDTGESARVAKAVDGDTVILDDGRQVRLVGIQAPKLPLGRKNFKKWPLAGQAKQTLEKITLGQPIKLAYGGERIDRHGRILAHMFLVNGTWVQGEMLKAGMARTYTFPDNRKLAARMYALESEARGGERGIWSHPFYAVLTPEETSRHIGTFQVVEGRIIDAAKVKGVVYLNFGDDWRTDFTVSMRSKALRMFKKEGSDPLSLKGKAIRVRGWLEKRNGPMIEASHPEQIEVGAKLE